MLPSLPGPGTPPFVKLVRALAPFGIDPAGVSVEAPSSKMSDVVLAIVLLEKRVVARITASSFDLFVTTLFVDDERPLVNIAEAVLVALREIDAEVDQGEVNVRTSSHLSLVSEDIQGFLGEQIKVKPSMSGFSPDAAVYKIRRDERTYFSEARIVIANSIGYPNSLFVDFNAKYVSTAKPEVLANWIMSDFEAIMERIGLREVRPQS
jgi:hypothetical protein